MEKEVDEKLDSLKMYVPFINYLLHLDEDKYKKFKYIQHWIVTRKRYPMIELQKIEQAIITQYRNLFYDEGKVPKYIMDIFNTHAHAKCFRVNLCSDDEDDSENTLDIKEGDDDVIIVSTSPQSSSQDKIEPQAETANQFVNDIIQETSSVSQCCKSKKQEATSNPVLDSCIMDEPICIDSDDDEDEVLHSTVPFEDELYVNETQLFKRRRDFLDTEREESKKDQEEKNAIEPEWIEDQQTDKCKEKRNPNQVVVLQNGESDFNNMDIGELKQIYTDLTKESGIGLEQLLKRINLTSTQIENNTKKSPHDDFNSSPIYPNSSVSVTPYPDMYTNAMQPNVYNMPQQTPLRLNLKDPRIVKLLERSKTLHLISMGLPVRSLTQSTESPISEPKTYGEYRRLKAEKLKKAEFKQLEEAKKAKELNRIEEAKKVEELKKLNEVNELKKIEEEKKTNGLREIDEAGKAEELKKMQEAKKAKELKIIEKAKRTKRTDELKTIEKGKRAKQLKTIEEAKKAEELTKKEEAERTKKLNGEEELKRIEEAKRTEEIKCIKESRRAEELTIIEEEAKRKEKFRESWKNSQNGNIKKAEDTRTTDKTKEEVNVAKVGLVRNSKETDPKTKLYNLDNNTVLSTENLIDAPFQSTEISSSTSVPNAGKTDLRSIILNAILPYGDKILNVLKKDNELQVLSDKLLTLDNSKQLDEEITVASAAVNSGDQNTKAVNNVQNKLRLEERTKCVPNFKKIQKSKKRPRKEKEPKENPTHKRIRSISSSSSTTSYISSTTSNPSTKRTSKSQSLVREPIVKLRRLSPETILTYTKMPLVTECKTINIRLVEDVKRTEKTVHNLVMKKPTKLNVKYKNIDTLMTNDNTKLCVLCKSKPSDLTNHYKRVHKTESYVARLSISALHYLENNVQFAQKLTKETNSQKYLVKCVFCEDEIEDKFINAYKHFSIHTGEYAFQCDNCKLEKPYEFDIQSHKSHAKSCRNAAIRTLYQYPPNVLVIYLYCCKICNFVQLNEANTFKHLRDHHEKRQDDSSCITRYILTAIKDEETCEKSPESDINYELVNKDYDEDILVKNEAILDDGVTDFHKNENENVEAKESTLLLERHQSFEGTFSNGLAMIELPYTKYTKYSSILNQNLLYPNPAQPNNIQPIVLSTMKNIKNSCVASSLEYTKTECSDILPIHNENYNFKKVLHNSSNIFYRQYANDVSSFGLYKCMATDCLFSTDAKEEILKHLKEHLSSECPPEDCLLCAYCQLDAEVCSTPEMLIEHVQTNHKQSQFQCSVCFYRGITPSYVSLHFKHAHPEQELQIVYKCGLDIAVDNSVATNVSELLKENVQPLVCPLKDCLRNFYSLIWMKNHMMHAHSLPIKSKCITALEKYACIYCTMNFYDMEMVKNHLAMCHPDKQSYVCERVLLSEKEEDLLQNLIVSFVSLPIIPDENIRDVKMKQEFALNLKNDMSGREIDKSGNMSDLIAANPFECDTKPNLEQLVHTAEESVKVSLLKLIRNTGISPNLLYHCPEPTCGGFFSSYDLWHRHMSLRHCCLLSICPHCVNNKNTELPLVDFKEHFQEHCCHLYGCFHCGETFSNEQASRDHITLAHLEINADTSAIQLEKVPLYFNHYFNILLKSEQKKDRYNFLLELQEVVQNRCKYADKLIYESLKTQWIVPCTASWLENFPSFKSNVRVKRKCFCQNCSFQTSDNEILYAHLRNSHQLADSKFACAKCDFRIACENWEPIIDHIKMHVLNIHICSVCSYYHHNRQKIRQHITHEHRFKDVPIVTIIRSSVNTQISLAIVFAQQRKTFSTIKSCFCCVKSSKSWQAFATHLKKVHLLTLQYFCEICDESFKLTEYDAHFTNCHPTIPLRIRCQIATNTQISIDSIMPLKFSIEANVRDPLSGVKIIKQEPCNIDTDSDIELINDEDIVIANDVKLSETQQNPKEIRCVNFENLQSQNSIIENFETHMWPQTPRSTAVPIPHMPLQLQLKSQLIPQLVPPMSTVIATSTKNSTLDIPRLAIHSQNLNFGGDCNYRPVNNIVNATGNSLNNSYPLQNFQP